MPNEPSSPVPPIEPLPLVIAPRPLVAKPIPPLVPAERPMSLDDAAATLLAYLPPVMTELIDALCKEHGVKPAAYLLSYCRLAYERGEVATFVAEDDVRRADTGEAVTLVSRDAVECAFCHTPFTASRVGQRFCADPDDGSMSCGRKSTLETMHAGREQYLRRTRPEREAINRVAAPR